VCSSLLRCFDPSATVQYGYADTLTKTLQFRCGRSRRKERTLGRRAHTMKFPLYAGSTRIFKEGCF
jgi:hypothetical protein